MGHLPPHPGILSQAPTLPRRSQTTILYRITLEDPGVSNAFYAEWFMHGVLGSHLYSLCKSSFITGFMSSLLHVSKD